MLEQFYPRHYVRSAYGIPYRELYEKGIRGVIFDVDNTLVPHDAPADKRAVKLFEEFHAMGVAAFAGAVGTKYIYKAGKPSVKGYAKAMEVMGTNRDTTIFVGDQLFTDVWGANRAGIVSFLTEPIDPKEEIQIVLKRYPEKLILWFYRRSLRGRRQKAGRKES